ncbi:MAG: universal stress protein [Kangiellaceae bacterium]|nr:universal stress protein [Kangiellaceae bacterium]MCW8998152.1 universal stress protein [Kangiellaceae bacterium]MCW9017812.1 universal stress protein [Kangiellaceae bacterium]
MQSINNILVCLDPDRDEQPALQKAIFLAQKYQASIELLLVVYNRGLVGNLFFNSEQFEAAKNGYINSQKRWIDSYVEEVTHAGLKCSYDVLWHKPLYEAILNKAEISDCDLVMKSTHEHPTINKVFFTPNDWQLLKSCKKPLILAKTDTKKEYTKVLAAVDPTHSHDKPESLDPLIIRSAEQVAKVVGAEVHAIHCYDPIGYQLWSDIGFGMGVGMGPTDFTMGEENYDAYVDQLKQTKQEGFDEALKGSEVVDNRRHLVEGYPETLLPDFVEKNTIDLLVLGTTYHSGLVGSTAEKILDPINCDVLSVHA